VALAPNPCTFVQTNRLPARRQLARRNQIVARAFFIESFRRHPYIVGESWILTEEFVVNSLRQGSEVAHLPIDDGRINYRGAGRSLCHLIIHSQTFSEAVDFD